MKQSLEEMRTLCEDVAARKDLILQDHEQEGKQQNEDYVQSVRAHAGELGMLGSLFVFCMFVLVIYKMKF